MRLLNHRGFLLANGILLAVQIVSALWLLWLVGFGTPPIPADYLPATVADSVAFWNDKPTVAVLVSIVLTMLTLVISLGFPQMRRMAMAMAGIAIARHVIWRTFFTLQFDDPVSATVGLLLYGAELYGIISLALGFYQMYRPVFREPPDPVLRGDYAPTVDILVPTYTEPVDVLFRTIVGCLAIDYPHKTVYILDDGNRSEVRALCEQLGCRYIARASNKHAKAGNLNNALRQTDGELVVVFDADHVPVKTFLQRTVPYFINPDLGFVQTPQHFATLDPFQRNLIMQQELSNEQDLFYHVILPGLDACGSVTFAGSGTVFRRKALEDVGGFAVETVTEDMHTGLRLHAKGWRSIYVNEDLSAGLAPETFGDFLNQRLRWGRGATQVFVIENPLFKKGLSLSQKLCYFNNLWYFLHGIPRVIFLLSPLMYLLFGVVTIHASFLDVLSYYLSFGLICSLTYMQVSGRVRQVQWAELYETVFCFFLSMVTLCSLVNPYKAHFKVTPKGITQSRLSFELGAVLPQLVLLGLTFAGLAVAGIRAVMQPETVGYLGWNGLWALYNSMLLGCAVLAAVDRPQRRAHPRVDRALPVEVKTPLGLVSGRSLNLSENGLYMLLDEPVPVRSTLQVKLYDWSLNRQTEVRGKVVRGNVTEDGRHYVAIRLVDVSLATRRHMVLHTFTAPDTWTGFHTTQSNWRSILNLLGVPWRWMMARELPNRRIDPRFPVETGCVLLSDSNRLLGIGRTVELSEMGATVALPAKYRLPALGKVRLRVTLLHQGQPQVIEIHATVVRRESATTDQVRYSLQFPTVGDAELDQLQTFLFSADTQQTVKRVYGERNVQDARFRIWNNQNQARWQNVRFIQAGTIDNSQGQYVPFNLRMERVSSMPDNIVPLRRR